ncbi:hypothetical protein ACLESD_52545, partial [Pyxidicoccus sp. 3LFB2]
CPKRSAWRERPWRSGRRWRNPGPRRSRSPSPCWARCCWREATRPEPRPLLEQALAGWEQDGANALNLAIVRFALAQALRQEGADAARARALALAARDAVAPTAEPRIVRLDALNAFLLH